MADSLTVGSKVLTDGHSISHVYELLGPPVRSVEVENKYGARIGDRLEWYRDGKVIRITIRGGRVVSIFEST